MSPEKLSGPVATGQETALLGSCSSPSFLPLDTFIQRGGLPGQFRSRPASELTSDSSHGTSQSCQQKSNHKLNRKGKDERGNDQIQALCWVWGSDVLQPHWPSGGFPAFLEFVRVLLASVSIPILDVRTKNSVPADLAGSPLDFYASSEEEISHLRQDWVG